MAEKLIKNLGSGPHTLNIGKKSDTFMKLNKYSGKSFEKKSGGSVYHSIRYDFKPKSIDEERMGNLEVRPCCSVFI